jgi:hypothetical protein
MSELLPNGEMQSYYSGYCKKCGAEIEMNIQGNPIDNHVCVVQHVNTICPQCGKEHNCPLCGAITEVRMDYPYKPHDGSPCNCAAPMHMRGSPMFEKDGKIIRDTTKIKVNWPHCHTCKASFYPGMTGTSRS